MRNGTHSLEYVLINRYVPKPNPQVFRITKDNHNILQGMSFAIVAS